MKHLCNLDFRKTIHNFLGAHYTYGHFSPMCKSFGECLECNWNTFLDGLSQNEVESIFCAFGCANEDDTFNEIGRKGNEGFHEFIKKLKEVENFDKCV